MRLRAYQERGLSSVYAAWHAGSRRVLMVAPTGAGKGAMACTVLARVAAAGKRGLFVAHRREIVLKSFEDDYPRLGNASDAAAMVPGRRRDPSAPIQFASAQSILAAPVVGDFDYVVIDEAHHYVADEWRRVLRMFPRARVLGLTATTNRSDRRPMRDVFDELVVAATYSELLEQGHIVPCRVLRPSRNLGMDLAQHPVTAYERYANGEAALVYVLRVADALALAQEFNAAGHVAAAITEETTRAERDAAVQGFRDGSITVIVNVYTMTEGVDIPRASAAILARRCENEITYMQTAGRILRPYNGAKEVATLIDLTGASIEHGNPTIDREYTLDAPPKASRAPVEAVERGEVREPNVLGVDLITEDGEPAAAGEVSDAKRERWSELRAEIDADRMSADAAHAQYRREFGENCPWASRVPQAVRMRDARNQAGELATDTARAYL